MRRSIGDQFANILNPRRSAVGDQVPIAPHELVGHGHQLAEHFCGGFVDAHVIAEALGHFALPISRLNICTVAPSSTTAWRATEWKAMSRRKSSTCMEMSRLLARREPKS